jgi:crotonobetainyl-CoA:carnitine CoA-transferase CaiB-like acyl-CoA transferase
VNEQQELSFALSGYRVLDMTEGGCMIGGKMLADLGADVIKIEVPGGSPSRVGPFYKDIPDPEKSLFWFAYNLNKRGITLDINKADGQEIFKRLVKTADIIMESFPPGYLQQLGLGYATLSNINSCIIMTSISLFGQDGPKAHYKGSDLTIWASGGFLYLCGEPETPPVWISFPQASLFGGAEAASGTMAALWHRQMTGEGQQVDVSMQECAISPTFRAISQWDLNKFETKRTGLITQVPVTGVKLSGGIMKCKDGYIALIFLGGSDQAMVKSTKSLVQWMDEEGMASKWLKEFDWVGGYDSSTVTQDVVDRVQEIVAKFIATKTKEELYEEGGVKRGIFISPISDAKYVYGDQQLRARDFWMPVFHPELGEPISYCGPFVKLSETPIKYRWRAPLIGEHNEEIYQKEIGLSKREIILLKQAQVI